MSHEFDSVTNLPIAMETDSGTDDREDHEQILDLTVSTNHSNRLRNETESPSTTPSSMSSRSSANQVSGTSNELPTPPAWFTTLAHPPPNFRNFEAIQPFVNQHINLFGALSLPQAIPPPLIFSTLTSTPSSSSSQGPSNQPFAGTPIHPTQSDHSMLPHFSNVMELCNAISRGVTTNRPVMFNGKSSIDQIGSNECKSTDLEKLRVEDHVSEGGTNGRTKQNPLLKYGSYVDCGLPRCRSSGLREHYHCVSCSKVIIRREEVIRHAKWHRKREESLQYGFMRYSPGDNCQIDECVHNGRQTHYHCMKPNCTKVYISTSDVQMHANFHRKDEIIIQEGFRRFRASEDCGVPSCPFYREHTTHFHCCRRNCHFTFKNKADMEKHKLHHQKNDNFAKDGFRKFIKCESCGFRSCKYSGIINHIHCVRPGCDYVVHSSSQILSHKRKHDRRNSTCSRLLCSTFTFSDPGPTSADVVYDMTSSQGDTKTESGEAESHSTAGPASCELSNSADLIDTTNSSASGLEGSHGNDHVYAIIHSLLIGCIRQHPGSDHCGRISLEEFLFSRDRFSSVDESVSLILALVNYHFQRGADVSCSWPLCDAGQTTPTHCPSWVSHAWKAAVLISCYNICSHEECTQATMPHLHCYGCNRTVFKDNLDLVQLYNHVSEHDSRLEHLDAMGLTSQNHQFQLIPSQLHRRRGRPPKYAKYICVPRPSVPDELCINNPHIREIKRAMFTTQTSVVCGVKLYLKDEPCPDNLCEYSRQQREHFHCVRPRCYMATDSVEVINAHRREFHNHVSIAPGFEHFDQSVDCRRPACHSKRMSHHYHCTHANCDYAFIRPTTMTQHARKHEIARANSDDLFAEMNYPFCDEFKSGEASMNDEHEDEASGVAHIEPPCLPLGMSQLAAAQLPNFLTHGASPSAIQQTMNTAVANGNQSLPGFLPIWAAAMAAAMSAMSANPNNPCALIPPLGSESGNFSAPENLAGTMMMIDSRCQEEESRVGV